MFLLLNNFFPSFILSFVYLRASLVNANLGIGYPRALLVDANLGISYQRALVVVDILGIGYPRALVVDANLGGLPQGITSQCQLGHWLPQGITSRCQLGHKLPLPTSPCSWHHHWHPLVTKYPRFELSFFR